MATQETGQRFDRIQVPVLGIGLDAPGSTQAMVVVRISESRKVCVRQRAQMPSRRRSA